MGGGFVKNTHSLSPSSLLPDPLFNLYEAWATWSGYFGSGPGEVKSDSSMRLSPALLIQEKLFNNLYKAHMRLSLLSSTDHHSGRWSSQWDL